MFCKNCGTELREGAVFCPNCGTKISGKTGIQKMLPFIILAIVLVALAGIIIAVVNGKKDTPTDTQIHSDAVSEVASTQSIAEDSYPQEDVPTETETTVQEVASPTALSMTAEEIDAEVLRIREVWTADRDAISSSEFQVVDVAEGIKYYLSGDDLKMVEVQSGVRNGYNMTFQIENGMLTFAYYESQSEQIRLYFKDEKLFRWIQTDAGAEAVIHDLDYSNEMFSFHEQYALNEITQILISN